MLVDAQRSPLPGPRPVPLVGARGNLLPFIRNPLDYMSRLYQSYGEVVSLARGTTEYVFAFSPEYNRQVLGNTTLFYNLDASTSPLCIPRNSSLSRLFAGLSQMNGDRHRRQRQLMMPALQKKRLDDYYGDIVAVTEQWLAGWRVGQQRDLFEEMRGLTLSIAVKTLVGVSPDRGGRAMCRLLESWQGLVFSPPAILLPFDLPGSPYRRLLTLSERLEAALRELISRKRAEGPGRDALSALMQAHDEDDGRMTDDELVGQTNFLFMAGHATTASALTWTLFLLDQHPRALNDLLDECDAKLHGGTPAREQLDELPLLEAAIKESIRLLPPVLWWSRVSTAPFYLGGYEVPEGARVISSAYVTHRLADHYAQPDKFIPERWRTFSPDPYAYLPFSAGPRACPGAAFAMVEMKLILATILQRYRTSVRPRAPVDLGGLMLSSPRRGLPVLIEQQARRKDRREVRGNIRRLVNLN